MSETTPTPDEQDRPARVAARRAPPRIGRYRVLRTIARGGMAEVYEVLDPDTHERVALKWLVSDGDAELRFEREVLAMSRLNHPGVARVFAHGEQDGKPYLTVELVDGLDLVAYVDAFGAPGERERTREVARLCHQIAVSLDHVHARGLVHRDLKPGNIVVLPDGQTKLLDFGIVHVAGARRLTADGEFLGTLAYAAPEQFDGRVPGPAADLYALGCLLYRLLTGERPFTASSPAQMARLHLSRPPARPVTRVAGLPHVLDQLVLALLRKDPKERPARGLDVARVVAEWLAGDVRPALRTDLERASRRAVGSEADLVALADVVGAAGPGDLVLVRGARGARRPVFVDLVLAEARSRGDDVFEVLYGEPDVEDELTRAGGHPGPAIVGLYDLHRWSDAHVGALARARAAAREAGARVVFVGDVERPHAQRPHPDEAALQADAAVDVHPLDAGGAARFVGAILHRRPPPLAVARSLHDATGGDPSELEEVVRGLVKDGLVDDVDLETPVVRWGWRAGAQITVPERAVWALDQALVHLDADVVRLLYALAVADEPLTARQAAVAADLDGDAVSAALPVLSELPLLDVGVGPEPTFAFASSRDARILRDRLPEEAAGPIARRLLDAFGDGLSASARVRLYPAVGRTADAVRPALQVAIAELDGGACERAVSRLAPLVAAAPDLSLWGHDHGRLLLVQALAVAQAHPADPAVGRLCTEAAPLVDDPTDRVRRSYGLGLHAAALGRAPEARRLFGEAAEAAGDPAIDEQVRADVWFAAAEAAESGGDGGGASRRWARLEAAPGDRPATAAARAEARLRRLWLAADFTGAWAAGLEAVDAYVAVDDAIRWARAAAALVEVGLELGAVSESLSRVRVAGRRARQLDTPLPAARLGLAEAGLELALGRLGRAQLLVEDVESALPAAAPLALHVEAELLAARVAAATAPEASGRVDAVARKAERVGMTRVVRVAQASRAAALAAQGRTQLAAEEFARVVEHLRGTGDGATLVRVLRARVRALGHLIDPDALVRPLRGWPGLPDARPLRLDLARARAAFRRAQLLDPSEADAEAASIEAAWRAGCDVEEREALRLSCG